MARTVDWDSVPDSTILEDGIYEMEVESITEGATKAGALMYTGLFRVADGEHAGTPIYDRFAVGNADDPTADDPQTWVKSVGARRLKRLFKACGLTLGPDVDEMVKTCTQQHFVATIVVEVDDGVKDPKYKGVRRNRIAAMYPLADRPEPTPAAAPRPMRAVAPKVPVTPPKAARAASVPKVPTVRCGYCQEMIPRDEYVAHIDTAHADAE